MNSISGFINYFLFFYRILSLSIQRMKHLKIILTDKEGKILYDATHGVGQGNVLEETLAAFEDYLAEVHKIDPMVNSLDFVDVVSP